MKIKYGSDCSGIEAPYIALANILGEDNIDHEFSSDNDKYVKESIKCNFKPKLFYDDVFNRNIKLIPYVDIYVAGFPCQTFSTAGKRGGFEDDRGIVFFSIYEYIRNAKPKVIVLENVKGLTTHDKGKTFSCIMNALNKLKCYNIYHKVMSPDDYGWPQHRPRIFIICIRKDSQLKEFNFPMEEKLDIKASDLLDPNIKYKHKLTFFEKNNLIEHKKYIYRKYDVDINKHYFFTDIGASVAFGKPMYEIVPCLKSSRSNYYITKLGRKLTLDEVELIQGFPMLKICVSDSQYLKQLGNSMCIPLLEKIFTNILMSVNLNN